MSTFMKELTASEMAREQIERLNIELLREKKVLQSRMLMYQQGYDSKLGERGPLSQTSTTSA